MLIVRLAPVTTATVSDDLAELRAWLRDAQRGEDAPHFVVGRPEMVQYASEYFVRQMHCNREEAKKFTAQLTADVRTIMAGRSVLPPPHSETCDASSADLLPHLTHQPYTST